jgi:hypothetical protein
VSPDSRFVCTNFLKIQKKKNRIIEKKTLLTWGKKYVNKFTSSSAVLAMGDLKKNISAPQITK